MSFQCYTHRFLGWKIQVLDACEFDEGVAVAETVAAEGGAGPGTLPQ